MHTYLTTPLGFPARRPLGYRRDGRPIYPVAGGDGRAAVLPATVDACVERMDAIADEMQRLTRFERLTQPQAEERDRLVEEFDQLDAHRSRLRVQVAFADGGMRGLEGGGGGNGRLRMEGGSPRGTSQGEPTPASDLRGRALDVLEATERSAPHLSRTTLDSVARVLDSEREGEPMARYIRVAGDADYLSAFHKVMRNPAMGQFEWTEQERAAFARAQELQRAMSLTDGAGGYMVPLTLDPAILLSGPGTSNTELRSAFTVKTIATDSWHGVTSAGVTAGWRAEAAETTDASPALAEAVIPCHRGDAFVPFSFEVGADAPGFAQEMATLLEDAKQRLEAAAFITGSGTGQPNGLVTAAVAAGKTVATTTADTYVVADVYKLKAALPPRWRKTASWLANDTVYDVTRQFASGTGPQSAFWADLAADTPPQLLGKPALESSEMDGTIEAAAANYLLGYGDLRQYVVVDRVGTTIELVPHLFGTNRRPTGERGFFCWFRTGGNLVVPDAVRLLNA